MGYFSRKQMQIAKLTSVLLFFRVLLFFGLLVPYCTAYALIFLITSFGLTYLVSYLGYWGLLVLILPVLIGYGYGLNHFKQLEIAAGRYPKKGEVGSVLGSEKFAG
jgi:hypothetical protein